MTLSLHCSTGIGSSLGNTRASRQHPVRGAQTSRVVPFAVAGRSDVAIEKSLRASAFVGALSVLLAGGVSAAPRQQTMPLDLPSPTIMQVAADGSSLLDKLKGSLTGSYTDFFSPQDNPNSQVSESQAQASENASKQQPDPVALISAPQQSPRLLSHLAFGLQEAPPLAEINLFDKIKGALSGSFGDQIAAKADSIAQKPAEAVTGTFDNVKGATGAVDKVKGATGVADQVQEATGALDNVRGATGALDNVKGATGAFDEAKGAAANILDSSSADPPAPSNGDGQSGPVSVPQGIADLFNPNKVTSPDVALTSKGVENTSSDAAPAKPRPDVGDLSSGFWSVEDGDTLRRKQVDSIRANAQYSPQKRDSEKSATPASPQEGVKPENDGSKIITADN